MIRVEPARIVMMQCARRGYDEGRRDGQILFSARRWGSQFCPLQLCVWNPMEKIPNEEGNVYRSKWDQEAQKVKAGGAEGQGGQEQHEARNRGEIPLLT